MKIKIIILTFCCIILSSFCYAVLDTGGNRSISARVEALGGAFVGDASDISSIMYNPAGASQLRGQNIIATHQKIFGGMAQFTYFGIGTHIIPNKHIGISYSSFEPSEDQLYPAKEERISLSLSESLDTHLLWGITLKYIRTNESWEGGGANSRGYGVDTGIIYYLTEKLKVGISVADLISNISYSGRTGNDVFETRLSVGASLQLNKNTKLFFDIKDPISFNNEKPARKPGDPDPYPLGICIGVENYLDEAVVLRAGYNGQEKKFTGGVGIEVGPWSIDYAYSPLKGGFLFPKDDAHRISVRMKLKK